MLHYTPVTHLKPHEKSATTSQKHCVLNHFLLLHVALYSIFSLRHFFYCQISECEIHPRCRALKPSMACTVCHTLLPVDEGLSLTDFMNEVCVPVCVCEMDLCHNSGVEQMGSLRSVFPAHIRGYRECCSTAVRESRTHSVMCSVCVCVCILRYCMCVYLLKE